mmetsp:Transcript_13431/g.20421  ORF Transcript_13431/g.20421 Transcript_13431/m.20421 type:complete len:107 (+) Transcript_13431:137-457(+)|eukprot:CAMPEP_0196808600 /NCGR_PEP_ID=MMETSP1362-20130617/8587_1 /TAXON_ID=163516 /ORGANISM="Leptocylindrus danicus, Strain CCMP1856" /LENGTH=106 /DNA_ID=CAMNT_0042182999 /DNA_START=84 /DNA_END=404 /DNA_ORIENTATION=-
MSKQSKLTFANAKVEQEFCTVGCEQNNEAETGTGNDSSCLYQDEYDNYSEAYDEYDDFGVQQNRGGGGGSEVTKRRNKQKRQRKAQVNVYSSRHARIRNERKNGTK